MDMRLKDHDTDKTYRALLRAITRGDQPFAEDVVTIHDGAPSRTPAGKSYYHAWWVRRQRESGEPPTK